MRFVCAKHKTEELWCYPYFKSYPIRLLVGFSNISSQVRRAGFLARGCGPTRIRTKRAPEARVSSGLRGHAPPGNLKNGLPKAAYVHVVHRPGGPYWRSGVLKTGGTFSSNTDRPRPLNNIFIYFFLENEGNAW